MLTRLSGRGSRLSFSKSATVDSATPDASASCLCDHFKRPRAARDCSEFICSPYARNCTDNSYKNRSTTGTAKSVILIDSPMVEGSTEPPRDSLRSSESPASHDKRRAIQDQFTGPIRRRAIFYCAPRCRWQSAGASNERRSNPDIARGW